MSPYLLPRESLAVNKKLRRLNEWEHSHLAVGRRASCLSALTLAGQGFPPAPQAGKAVLLLA